MSKRSIPLERVVLEKNDQIVTLLRASKGLEPDMDVTRLPESVQKAVKEILLMHRHCKSQAQQMPVILPPLEEYTAADLREGRAARAVTRNNALNECAAAIRRAGLTVSHEIRVRAQFLDDGLRVDSPVRPHWDHGPNKININRLGPRSQS